MCSCVKLKIEFFMNFRLTLFSIARLVLDLNLDSPSVLLQSESESGESYFLELSTWPFDNATPSIDKSITIFFRFKLIAERFIFLLITPIGRLW